MSQRKRGKQKRVNSQENLPVLKPNAAGIDIGVTEIFVAVPPDRDVEPVRSFPTFTEDLHRLADWLRTCRVDTVAMESTGVYWIPLFQILESRGFEVCLVNARYFQNVPGRKTDVSDCQWLRYLHAVGLLRGSFRPADEVCVLRSLLRHRDGLIQMAATHVLRMQKALDQMNLQIHHVISDITGLTGLKIIDAVLEGEREPESSSGSAGRQNQSFRRNHQEVHGWRLPARAPFHPPAIFDGVSLPPATGRRLRQGTRAPIESV